MRRLLGTVPTLAVVGVLTPLLLAGCGEDDPSRAADPAPTSPTTPTPTSPTTSSSPADQPPTSQPPTSPPPTTPGAVSFDLVEIVSGTAGRGEATGQAVELASEADIDAFVAGLSAGLADAVDLAYAANPVQQGQTLWAAVVALGCDVPPGVEVRAAGDGYTITGTKVADPLPECFAPVTSVALVAIDG